MSILVTGGAGFIGAHTIERLLSVGADPIVCIDNFNDYYDPKLKRSAVASFADRVKIVEGSFCDRGLVEQLFREHRFKQVVHLGAYAGVRPSVADPFPYQKSNVEGTLVLFEAARRWPVERFLSASSSTVYGMGAKTPFCEDSPLGVPMSPYGATKRAGEVMAETYHALHGLPVVSLRFFSVFGRRVRPDLALSIFTQSILTGRPVPLFGDGSIRRDLTHISDIVSGMLAALEAPNVEGEAINLGHNEPVSMRDLIATISKAAGREAIIDYQSPKPGELPVTCADLTKAKRLLGYEPKVSLDEGVRDYVAWHREYYKV